LGPAEVGSTANSYEIIARLAVGGMAEIFLARGVGTAGVERYVVLKRVLRHRVDDAAFVRMFLDEARLAAQLQHPNIAQVYDVGKLGDSYFFTMEYVHGETVRALLQRAHGLRRQIPLGAILAIIAGAAAGLHHAHDRRGLDGRALGIVHRDVSPSNLMLSYEGHVKVVDFGVAKAAHRSTETASGTVKGKISYLSPEQARGGSVDRRSDLFALGIVFWELLTLERLFRRNSDFENMVAIVNEQVRPPSALRSEVPPELDAIVMRLLDKDPAVRFQTADSLHEAIEQVAVRIGTSLSSASLGRYLRELFGERPEPWVEMRSQDAHGGNPVTLTSEPIPAELVTPVADNVDLQLGGVPDLTAPKYSDSSGHRMPSEGAMTQPRTRVESDPELQTARDVRRPSSPSRSPDPTRRSGSHSAPPPGVPTVSMHASAPPPPSTPPANVPLARPRVDPSWSHPSVSGPAREPEPVPSRGVPRLVYIVGPALALAIVIVIVMATGGGRSESNVVDAHEMRVHAPDPVGAAEPPAPAPPAPAPVDAAAVAVAPVDAAPAPTPVAKTPPPPTPTHSHPRPSPEEDLQKAFRAEHYTDVVQACLTMPSLAAQDPVACTLSACHVHDTTHAIKWLKATGGKRAAVLAGCAQLGASLEPAKPPPGPSQSPPVKHDCAANPLDCQH
jgi:serine/threonine-protein kinase